MSEDPISEDRVYARHERWRGAVLIVGVGAVGGPLAEELARLGVSPMLLVDFDTLQQENLSRHSLGEAYLQENKARALADKITREFSLCTVKSVSADFLKLPEQAQLLLVQAVDVVVVAADSVACRQRINEICFRAEVPSIYPAVQVNDQLHEAEVGEIIWVAPGHTPCYLCSVSWRSATDDGEVTGGFRADIMILVLATVWVVATFLNSFAERSQQFLDIERTCMFVRGFVPLSDAARALFPDGGNIRYARIPFPATPCPVCHSQAPPDPAIERLRRIRAEEERRQREQAAAAALAEQRRREAAELAEKERVAAAERAEQARIAAAKRAEEQREREEQEQEQARLAEQARRQTIQRANQLLDAALLREREIVEEGARQEREEIQALATRVLTAPNGPVARYLAGYEALHKAAQVPAIDLRPDEQLPPMPNDGAASVRVAALYDLTKATIPLLREFAGRVERIASQLREDGEGALLQAPLDQPQMKHPLEPQVPAPDIQADEYRRRLGWARIAAGVGIGAIILAAICRARGSLPGAIAATIIFLVSAVVVLVWYDSAAEGQNAVERERAAAARYPFDLRVYLQQVAENRRREDEWRLAENQRQSMARQHRDGEYRKAEQIDEIAQHIRQAVVALADNDDIAYAQQAIIRRERTLADLEADVLRIQKQLSRRRVDGGSRADLKLAVKSHLDVRHICPFCDGKVLVLGRNLVLHIDRHHAGELPFWLAME